MSVKPNTIYGGNSRNPKDIKNSSNQYSFHNQNNHSFNVGLLERNKTSYNLNKGFNVINLKASLNSSWKDKIIFNDKNSVNKNDKKVIVMSPIEENKEIKKETISSINNKKNSSNLYNSMNESQLKKKIYDNKSPAVVVKNKDNLNSLNSKCNDLSDKNTDLYINTIVDNSIDMQVLLNDIYKELEKLKTNDVDIVKKVLCIYKQCFTKHNIKNTSLYALLLPLFECREKTVNFSFLEKMKNKEKKMNSMNYNSKNNIEKVSLGSFNNINLKYSSSIKQDSNAFKKKLPINNKEKIFKNEILKEPFSNEIENSKMISLSSSTNFKEFKKNGLNANNKTNFSKDSSLNLNNSSYNNPVSNVNSKTLTSNLNLNLKNEKKSENESTSNMVKSKLSDKEIESENKVIKSTININNSDKIKPNNNVNVNLNLNLNDNDVDIKSLKSKVQILEDYVYTKKDEHNNIVNFVFCNKNDTEDIKMNLIQSRNKIGNIPDTMTFNEKMKIKDINIETNKEDNMRKTYAFDREFADLESEKRTKINSKLINDLEAIYFEDKVCGKNKSHSIGIPKLIFDFNNEEESSKNSVANPLKGNNISNNKFNMKINKKK